jgi:hypothetical protein
VGRELGDDSGRRGGPKRNPVSWWRRRTATPWSKLEFGCGGSVGTETTRCVPGSQQPMPLWDDHLDAHNGACRPLSSPTSNAASTLLGQVPNPLALQIRSGRTGDGDDRAVMTMRGGGWLGMGEGGGGIGQRGGWLWRQVRRRRHWHSIDGIMRGRGHGDGWGCRAGWKSGHALEEAGTTCRHAQALEGVGLHVTEGVRCTKRWTMK